MAKKTSAVVTRATTDKYTLYTVPPSNRGEWELLYLVSLTGTDSPSVFFYDSSTDTEYKIFGAKNIGTGDYLLLTNAIVVMEENDQIRVQNSSTNSVTYVVTVNLIQNIASSYHS